MAADSKDVLIPQGVGPNGHALVKREHSDGRVSFGEVRPIVHGKPLNGIELLDARPNPDRPGTFTAVTLIPGGPAQVATKAYREGWDAIFSKDAPN